ncbi:helix-turn-helix domain-containing protein [Sorangium sp. So ce1000]|uniref:helix-turn-helix domain-containing protein n=1 Tax=Sorangium sp. So ce1000 TaxID=3133325 RepID=UPI003F5FE7B1
MLVARSLDDFRAHPAGSYVAGRHWLYFAIDWTVFGYALWGTPAPQDLHALVHVLELELDREPHAAVVDVTNVDALSQEGFEILAAYVMQHADRLAHVVTRTAMIRSTGLNGAIASGFFDIVGSPFPVSFCNDLISAFSHLEHPRPRESAEALRLAIVTASGISEPLRELRQYLEANLATHSLASAARTMGVSSRTLQRRLGEHRTSFIEEAQEARVRVAERLLLRSDAPVTQIAIEVGCASSQHFSDLFRRRRGEAPSTFRARRRGI